VVKGIDANGVAFEDQAEIHDLSEEGLSFYFNRPLWVNSHLTIEIPASSIFPPRYIARAMVLRLQVDLSGKKLVAAWFNE
jgi:hypothetical protein